MSINDAVTTTREDVISMIACAEDYGFDSPIVFDFLWKLLGESLPSHEIEEYAASLTENAGFGAEDRDAVIEKLTEWREMRREEGER